MAANGYFIREMAAAAAFIPTLAFAVEDDVGPDSYHVTGTQVESYFDTKYAPVSGGAYVAWNSTSGLATSIATGSRIMIGDATTGAAITATDTILIGQAAGEDLVGGTGCIAIGTDAMGENVTGTNDTCLGYQAGKGVTGNSYSNGTFIGHQAGKGIVSAPSCTAVGSLAMSNGAVSGLNNTAVGYEAGYSLSSGTFNVLLGDRSGRAINSGSYNVVLGNAGRSITSGQSNFCMGFSSGNGISTHNSCVFIGKDAGVLTQHSEVTCIGGSASAAGVTHAGTVSVGYQACRFNVTGDRNTVIGTEAGKGVTGNSHSDNTFIGYKSGFVITVGGGNTCLGSYSGDLLAGGGDNVFAGHNAGGVFTSGSGNICLGHDVGLTAPTATTSNQLFIDNADVDEDNAIVYAEMDNHVMKLNADVRITEPGVETADAEGQLDVIQTDTAGAQPVVVLDQDDISEEFIKFYGSAAAATITQSLVAAADVTTATVNGYIRVNVQDEGNQITDGAYYLPVYALT